MIAWKIWSHQNSVVWRGHYQTPALVINGASSVLFYWQQAQVKVGSTTPEHRHQDGGLVWQKPTPGWVTCNVDAAVSGQRNNSSFGCLIGDEHVRFQAGYSEQLAGIIDPKIVEVMTFREASSWVKKRDQNNIIFELDVLAVVQAMKRRKGDDVSYFGVIISDWTTMIKDLRSSNVCFVRRPGNIAAHTTVREASFMYGREE